MNYRVRRITCSPDYVLGAAVIAGIIGIAASTAVTNPYTRVLPPLVLLGAVLGYAVRDREITDFQPKISARVLLIAFFSTAAATNYLFASSGYVRTTSVHVLTVALFVLLAALLVRLKSISARFGLLIGTGLLHRTTVYYASAAPMGNDGLFHNRMGEAIATNGSLAPLAADKYWYAPVYHLLTASGVSVFDVTGRHAAFVLVTLTTTVLLVGVVYVFVERHWSETVAFLGGWLVLVGDRVILNSVHTTTTSLGAVLFALLLLYAERFDNTGRRRYLAFFSIFLLGLIFTHQMSLFVAVVCVGAYVLASSFWRHRFGQRSFLMISMLVGAFLIQTSYSGYTGPEDESPSFLEEVGGVIVSNFGEVFGGSGGRPQLPPGDHVALAGADAMSLFHVAGNGLLIAFAIVGCVCWIRRTDGISPRIGLSLGTGVAAAGVFIYVIPLMGITTFLPDRWLLFMYVMLAVLAAPGLAVLFSSRKSIARGGLALLVVFALVLTPYALVMTTNGTGAIDGPVIDNSPAADRSATTSEELAAYQFAIEYAGSDVTVVSDHTAAQLLSRHFEQSASIYETTLDDPGTTRTGEELLVYRGYAKTHHVSYHIEYEDRQYHVYGPLPGPTPTDSIIYTNGEDRVAWNAPS